MAAHVPFRCSHSGLVRSWNDTGVPGAGIHTESVVSFSLSAHISASVATSWHAPSLLISCARPAALLSC
eukprot:7389876-Prymnesium_polylepis.1